MAADKLDIPVPPLGAKTRLRGVRYLWVLVWQTIQAYFDDGIAQLGAALAFYTTFAVAPLLVLAIALAGIIFDEDSARQRVFAEIQQLAGAEAGRAVASVEHPAAEPSNAIATLLGVVTLIAGALGVFSHLQDALNAIWHVQPRKGEHWVAMIRRRVFSLAMVVVTGFILLVSLIATATLGWLSEHAAARLGWPPSMLKAINFGLSFTVITFLFAMIFKLLPDARVLWRDVWLGALVTASLFNAGKAGLGWYFAHGRVGSSYGVAGSLIVLLLWVYYAAQIVFIGAEFTRVHTTLREGRIQPRPEAESTGKI